jgi:hypothetical protein
VRATCLVDVVRCSLLRYCNGYRRGPRPADHDTRGGIGSKRRFCHFLGQAGGIHPLSAHYLQTTKGGTRRALAGGSHAAIVRRANHTSPFDLAECAMAPPASRHQPDVGHPSARSIALRWSRISVTSNLREICRFPSPICRARRDTLKIRSGAVADAYAVVHRPCQAGRQQYVGRGELTSHEILAAVG